MSTIFLFLAGACKALADLSSESNPNIPRAWRKSLSWTNKWVIDHMGRRVPNTRPAWMYLWFAVPASQEKFLYSSTLLVLFTDFWHTIEFLRALFVIAAVVAFMSCGVLWVDVLALVTARLLGFTLVYNSVKSF